MELLLYLCFCLEWINVIKMYAFTQFHNQSKCVFWQRFKHGYRFDSTEISYEKASTEYQKELKVSIFNTCRVV